ncbi:MAG: holo-[acyl-carrier-protein] synthase [Tindallia sp. MSAO_Bac2]|nr:MAG: holo-[acyl-carrier-protein] synthase [Tindallia sp. MSAO_Bac2]
MIVSVGTDLIEISRIKKAIEKNNSFLQRILTAEEQEQFAARGSKAETVAGMFAAKEAVAKVLGTGIGKVSWHEIVILKDPEGAPFVKLKGAAGRVASHRGIDRVHISITHSRELAMAYAIGEGNHN